MGYKDKDKQRAFQRQWQRKQNLIRRTKVLKMLGDKCKRCGYNDNASALQIDHIKPLLRDYGDGSHGSNQRLVAEICRGTKTTKNLQILCANCHAIKTKEEDAKLFKQFNNKVYVPKKQTTWE